MAPETRSNSTETVTVLSELEFLRAQRDAACQVIRDLTRERDEARAENERLKLLLREAEACLQEVADERDEARSETARLQAHAVIDVDQCAHHAAEIERLWESLRINDLGYSLGLDAPTLQTRARKAEAHPKDTRGAVMAGEAPLNQAVAHSHRDIVQGCYRCDLALDEIGAVRDRRREILREMTRLAQAEGAYTDTTTHEQWLAATVEARRELAEEGK